MADLADCLPSVNKTVTNLSPEEDQLVIRAPIGHLWPRRKKKDTNRMLNKELVRKSLKLARNRLLLHLRILRARRRS
jgi:hypothetical protein